MLDYLNLVEKYTELHLKQDSLTMSGKVGSRLADICSIHERNIVQVVDFATQMEYVIFNTFSVRPNIMVEVVFFVKHYENYTCYPYMIGVYIWIQWIKKN